MKKVLLVTGIVVTSVTIVILLIAIVLSFKVVRQNTDKINSSLRTQLSTIVDIPPPIPPETRTFTTTTYIWEMETTQKEITKVKFTHDTLFDNNNDKFNATLEMEAGQDPSLFNKVLPAVITDAQTNQALSQPEKANLGANNQAGYSKISLFEVEGRDGQVGKIVWEFPKDKIIGDNSLHYSKIHSLPRPILKSLYELQRFIIEIFST